MLTVNVHDAKTHLSRLLADIEKGETVTIARAGVPVATLSPVHQGGSDARVARRFGALKGHVQVPEDFDTMGSEEIRSMFEGA
ncbi:type II toxin-antitoxin system Phd/YefM family antitoxin [Promicromonospora sp. NPDC060271]|uniref:type II toxin-antitoxin system Phd/YefM family antitoxin n=1 Tax=Promicromonospora sp. NPDC060271 TaxID=3347089 RepID=UPI0036697334